MQAEPSWTTSELSTALDIYEQELRDRGLRRNTINTYVQHPERFIRWLANAPTPQGPRGYARRDDAPSRSKYDPLFDYLSTSSDQVVSLSFSEIEEIIGFFLPPSAHRYHAWWANQYNGNHSHAQSWIRASYATRDVDLTSQTVNFINTDNPLWAEEEAVLLLDLYFRLVKQLDGKLPKSDTPEIVELSELLNRLPIHDQPLPETFRNPTGVSMRYKNYVALDPDDKRRGFGPAKVYEEVWDRYSDKRDDLKERVAQILDEFEG